MDEYMEHAYASGPSCAVQGTVGGLEGNEKELTWRWFVPSETPKQELVREPLHDKDRNPLFCEEQITWYEDSWKAGGPPDDAVPVGKLYATVYDHLVNGISLAVAPEQVRQQIWVMEEAHRQNPLG
jgi:hypothetical protein